MLSELERFLDAGLNDVIERVNPERAGRGVVDGSTNAKNALPGSSSGEMGSDKSVTWEVSAAMPSNGHDAKGDDS